MAHPSHRSSSTMDSEPLEDFEGAAGVTNLGNQTENLSHTCDLCQSKSPFASCFAYLHKGTFEFVRIRMRPSIVRALSSGEKSGRSEAEGLLRMRASSVARSITMRRTGKTTASPRPLGITMRKKKERWWGNHKVKRALDAMERREKRRRAD